MDLLVKVLRGVGKGFVLFFLVIALMGLYGGVAEAGEYKVVILEFRGGGAGDYANANFDKSIRGTLTTHLRKRGFKIVLPGKFKRILRKHGYTVEEFREDPSILAGNTEYRYRRSYNRDLHDIKG